MLSVTGLLVTIGMRIVLLVMFHCDPLSLHSSDVPCPTITRNRSGLLQHQPVIRLHCPAFHIAHETFHSAFVRLPGRLADRPVAKPAKIHRMERAQAVLLPNLYIIYLPHFCKYYIYFS